jgi:hypothetical protein
MAQAVSCHPFTVVAQVYAHVIPCRICAGQSDTGTGFSLIYSVSPVSIILLGLHTHVSSGECTVGPIVAAVQT